MNICINKDIRGMSSNKNALFFIFFQILSFMYMVILPSYMFVPCTCTLCRRHEKRASDPLELESHDHHELLGI